METRELVLNIAVNLDRLCSWAMENRRSRVEQFLSQTEDYIKVLEAAPKSPRFLPTYLWFKADFERLRQDVRLDEDWA